MRKPLYKNKLSNVLAIFVFEVSLWFSCLYLAMLMFGFDKYSHELWVTGVVVVAFNSVHDIVIYLRTGEATSLFVTMQRLLKLDKSVLLIGTLLLVSILYCILFVC
jgi:hypothetical protein